MIVAIDLDGTIADNRQRSHYIEGAKKNWDKYFDPELMAQDTPILEAILSMRRLVSIENTNLVFLTGRPERTRRVTTDWLERNFGYTAEIPKPHSLWAPPVEACFAPLMMRGDTDRRQAPVYKESWIDWMKKTSSPGNRPFFFIDDDTRCYDMYRKHGIVLEPPHIWSAMR